MLRQEVKGDLRLSQTAYSRQESTVKLNDGSSYWSFIPQALILDWSVDGSAVSAFQGRLSKGVELGKWDRDWEVRMIARMARRLKGNRLRFLPLHLAMEGFLALHFAGPSITWNEYSRMAIRDGLSPREETSVSGGDLEGFEDALRVFEIHPNQVGMLVFVGDIFTSAFVVPNPRDYALLHNSLLSDFYSELIEQFALLYDDSSSLKLTIRDDEIESLHDLEIAIKGMRKEWEEHYTFRMTIDNLLERPLSVETVYVAGPFKLERFITDLDPSQENHIGEMIRRSDGTIEYLKTFRLSSAQTRRGYLLSKLAENSWSVAKTAATLHQSSDELMLRIQNAGFQYLFGSHVLDGARSRARKRQTALDRV